MLKAGASSTGIAAAAAVAAWADAAGGASDERRGHLLNLVTRSMDIGHWASTDDIALLTGENEAQALTTLKGRRLMTAVNGPTFIIDRGYAFDGITQYIDSGFVASTMAQSMTPGNVRAGVYERTNVGANSHAFGAVATTGTQTGIVLRPRSATDVTNVQMASSVNTTSLSGITDSRGLTAQSRSGGATSVQSVKNGAALADVTGLTVNNTQIPDNPFFIGAACSTTRTPSFPRASTIGAAEWGAPLPGGTAAEVAWYAALQAFMTAIGANV